MAHDYAREITAIETLIDRLFQRLCWTADSTPDWPGLETLFHPEARLFPSARPANAITFATFAERMESQRAAGSLTSLQEQTLRNTVHVIGNTATAVNVYRGSVNGGAAFRGANMLTLVKDDGAWRIAAMAWQQETDESPIPADLA